MNINSTQIREHCSHEDGCGHTNPHGNDPSDTPLIWGPIFLGTGEKNLLRGIVGIGKFSSIYKSRQHPICVDPLFSQHGNRAMPPTTIKFRTIPSSSCRITISLSYIVIKSPHHHNALIVISLTLRRYPNCVFHHPTHQLQPRIPTDFISDDCRRDATAHSIQPPYPRHQLSNDLT